MPDISIISSIYNPKNLDYFINNTVNQTIFENCEWLVALFKPKKEDVKKLTEARKKFNNIYVELFDFLPTVYQAWNYLVARTLGEYVINFNCDDQSKDNHLEKLFYKAEYEELDIVYGIYLESTINEVNIENAGFETCLQYPFLPSIDFRTQLNLNCSIPHCRPMWRKRLAKRFGKFDETFKICSDYDFWLRCLKGGAKAGGVEEFLCLYYRNPEGISSKNENIEVALGEIDAIKKKNR